VPPHFAAQLRDHGLPAGMIAGLRGEGGVIGALFVANRDGVAAPFDAEEVRLCGTLAAHVGSWLGQDRLEHRVSELRESQAELYHQAFHDPLTGLANRLLFTDRVRHALTRRSGSATVIYIDLDDFKPVNDTLGHDAGDQLLCAVAERLRDSLRPADTAARLGGDEFAVLLTDVAPNDAVTVANRILRAFGKPLEIAGRPQTISASLGIATGACGELDGDQLVSNADAAMYVSKHGGKRGVSVHGGAERDPAADPPIGRSVPEPRAPVAQPVGGNGNR
jgi:diguanylate cyclase (GGDEF)-like protein